MSDDPAPRPGDADVRLRDAFAAGAEVSGSGAACPSPDELWESAAGRAGRRRQEAIVIHLGECSACAASWRLAQELQRDEGGTRVLPGASSWFRRNWAQVSAVAAMLVVAAGLALHLATVQRQAAPQMRGEEGDWIQPLVPEGAALSREDYLLRWTPGPDGTIYDVRVTTEDLQPLSRVRGLQTPQLLISPTSLVRVPPGGRVVWQVTAHLPDGKKVDSRSFVTGVR
jgi:hypothetical protein